MNEHSILITGGAGYLGRGILRYLGPNAKVTVYSRDEQKHYALRTRYPNVNTILGDVRDTDRLAAVMSGHSLVIHAAALKHIPEAERDVSVAYSVNVEGSRSVAMAAMRAGVQKVVGISTDKVCSPENVYGATKMLMERTFQEAQRMAPHIQFNSVRYGNVVSSTGSVVPLFRDQFEQYGEALITSANMTRFWFGVEDAVRLIEYAVDYGVSGYTYLARCPAMSILDVARAVWAYTGRNPEEFNHRTIGVRPGEKFHEVLLSKAEALYAIRQPHNYVAIPPVLKQVGETTMYEHSTYSSNNPDRWLTVEEMRNLFADAEAV